MTRLAAIAILLAACGAPAVAAEAPPQPGDPYMRVQRSEDAQQVQLQIALRRFEHPQGEKPPVYLAGVIHLGDASYYEAIQKHLDEQGLVLFEGAGQPEFLNRHATNEVVRMQRTRQAMSFLSGRVLAYATKYGNFPLSLKILIQEASGRSTVEAHMIRAATIDAWGNPIAYSREGDTVSLTSLGRGGKRGGRGPDRDITFDNITVPEGPAIPEPQHLHRSLAAGLGLVFQLDAVNYDRPHFQHSDMSMRQLHKVVYGFDPGPAAIFGNGEDDGGAAVPEGKGQQELRQTLEMLSGESATAGLLRIVTRFMGSSPRLQALARLLMAEMIGGISGDLSEVQGLPQGMAEMMKILIRDRNRIVMDDLERVLESEDPPRSISIFYGAGHMADLERRLMERFGYEPADEQWLTAFSADAGDTGLSPQQVEQLRGSVRAQMKMMQGTRSTKD